MGEAEFKRRFGGIDPIAYKQILSDRNSVSQFLALYR
jgi:hypothetical protein